MMNLEGRVVAITGAGRGIGLATAKALIAQGAKVCIGDIDLEVAKHAAAQIGAVACHVDVRDGFCRLHSQAHVGNLVCTAIGACKGRERLHHVTVLLHDVVISNQVDAGHACIHQAVQLACVGRAITVSVFPHTQQVELGVLCVDLAVLVAI